MTLLDRIRLAILGPALPSLEEAEADYIEAKARYDDAVARGDTRGQNQCLKALNLALNAMLVASYDAAGLYKYSDDRTPLKYRLARSRSARAV